ncbi:MAG: carbohydrate kinase family protein [Verrucomicrobia bacterium]|nr:carbohydrate kinase family protein [Verrucomicrobiota bacterium]
MMEKSVLVLGHWMRDHVVRLPPGMSLEVPLRREHVHSEVVSKPGGSGFHFALGAARAGFAQVSAVVCLGTDEASRTLLRDLPLKGICIVKRESQRECAQAVLLYDDCGRRSSFGVRGANLDLPQAALAYVQETNHDIVFLAGHLLEDTHARDTVLQIVETAKKRGSFVVFDLVPHHIHKVIQADCFERLFRNVDGLIGVPNTVAGALGRASPRSDDEVSEFVLALLDRFLWVCVHPSNHELVVGAKRGSQKSTYSSQTGYKDGTSSAGALDYPVARELHRFVTDMGG